VIKSLEIDKFKVYRDPQKCDLAPLTLIVGVNNSGKSTLFDALLTLSDQSQRKGPLSEKGLPRAPKERVGAATQSLEQGTTLSVDIDHQGQLAKLSYTHGEAAGESFWTSQKVGAPKPWLSKPIPKWALLWDVLSWFHSQEQLEDFYGDESYGLGSAYMALWALVHSSEFHVEFEADWANISPDLPKLLTLREEIGRDRIEDLVALARREDVFGITDLRGNDQYSVQELVFESSRQTIEFWDDWIDSPRFLFGFSGFDSDSLDQEKLKERLGVLAALYEAASDSSVDNFEVEEISEAMSSETFEEIVRSSVDDISSWTKASFGSFPLKVDECFRDLFHLKLFSGSDPDYENHELQESEVDSRLNERVEDVLGRFGMLGAKVSMAKPDKKGRTELMVQPVNGKQHSTADLGLGLRRLVAMTRETTTDSSIVLVEEPEAHLHQRAQAELGDYFIRQLKDVKGSQWLIETHSPHLLYRVLRRVRETGLGTLDDEDLALDYTQLQVLCVHPKEGGGSYIEELKVDPNGVLFDPLPPDFFESTLSDRRLGWLDS